MIEFQDEVIGVVFVLDSERNDAGSASRKEFCEDRVGRPRVDSRIIQLGLRHCLGTICGGWNEQIEIGAFALALTFVGAEEKGLIVNDGSAERAAEIIVDELRLRGANGIEEIAGIEERVAVIFVERTVKLVGAGLGDDVDD